MKRIIKIYCIEVSNDGSEFELRFEINGELVDKEVGYCIDDILFMSYEFYSKNCEKYNFDIRYDKLEINLNYKI